VCEQLYWLTKPSSEGLLSFLTRCTNLTANYKLLTVSTRLFIYKVLKVLKEHPKYAVWVDIDIMRYRGALSQFNDLVDNAREFFEEFAAERTAEQQTNG
jgi:hypothetical protein